MVISHICDIIKIKSKCCKCNFFKTSQSKEHYNASVCFDTFLNITRVTLYTVCTVQSVQLLNDANDGLLQANARQ